MMRLSTRAQRSKRPALPPHIPVEEHLATKHDIVDLKADLDTAIARLETRIVASEAKIWRLAITVASLAVLLNKFLDWVIK